MSRCVLRTLMAMATAPSLVAWPPMNPLAWMKMPPGTPHCSADRQIDRHSHRIQMRRGQSSLTLSESTWSLRPHHSAGSFLRESNEFGVTGTACRHSDNNGQHTDTHR